MVVDNSKMHDGFHVKLQWLMNLQVVAEQAILSAAVATTPLDGQRRYKYPTLSGHLVLFWVSVRTQLLVKDKGWPPMSL